MEYNLGKVKFKKILLINIPEDSLEKGYWKRIDQLTSKRVHLPKNDSKILDSLKDTDCLLVSFGLTIDKGIIDAAPNLKYIGVLATAFGKIDVDYAKKKDIIVCNLAGYSSESVAEFTIAAILEYIRGLEIGKRRGRDGNYDETGIPAWEIKNKVFGIIGLGSIGRRVAEIALGFGADTRYWSRNRKKDAEKKGIKYESLDSLIKKSDFLSINLAQNKDTEDIFNKTRFRNAKVGGVIINTGPMELVDLDGLVSRLKKKDMAFILDHSDEMTKENLKKISGFENCIIYPPMAYITKEAAITRQEMFTSNMENFLKGKPQNIVN